MRPQSPFECRWAIVALSTALLSASAFDRMDPNTVNGMSDDAKMAFIVKSLGAYKTPLIEAARRNRIPARLLATVVINELSDYGLEDQLQEKVYSETFTVGLGQTSVKLARERGHFNGLISETEISARMDSLRNPNPNLRNPDENPLREKAINQLAWDKLMDPPAALEVAARECSRIIDKLSANPGGPWAKHFLKKPIDRSDPYACMKPAEYPGRWNDTAKQDAWEKKLAEQDDLELAREISLTMAVDTAYNSDRIIDAQVEHDTVFALLNEKGNFPQARRHGLNAIGMWSEVLFNNNYPDGNDPFEGKWTGKFTLTEGSIAKAFHDLVPSMLQEYDAASARHMKKFDEDEKAAIAKITDAKSRQERQSTYQTERQKKVKEQAELKSNVVVPVLEYIDKLMFAGEAIAKTAGIPMSFEVRKTAEEKLQFGVTSIAHFPISPPMFVDVKHPIKKSGGMARHTLTFVNDPKDPENYWKLLDSNPLFLRLHRKEANNKEIMTDTKLKEYKFDKNDEPQLHFMLNWTFARIGD